MGPAGVAAGRWVTPSTTSAECLAEQGCFEVYDELDQLGVQRRFSKKSPTECTAVSGTYKHFFTWTSGKWIPGVSRNAVWRSRAAIPRNQWNNNTINFAAVESLYFGGVQLQSTFASKSSTLCTVNRDQVALFTVACDCTGSGATAATCFGGSGTVPVGLGNACAATVSNITAPPGWLYFAADSIADGCVGVSLSQISANLYKGGTQLTLSGNFAQFRQEQLYPVKNINTATVGQIIGDGLQVDLSSTTGTKIVKSAKICLNPLYPLNLYDDYTVPAFGHVEDGVMVPIGITVTNQSGLLCADLTNIFNSSTYFPIILKQTWATEPLNLYPGYTLYLVYILGAVFCATAAFSIYKMAVVVYGRVKHFRRFRVSQLMIVFIFLFNGVRGVYFFLLPIGFNAKSAVSDYVLVVLPTFFYFTAFTIIVSLWAVVCLQPMVKSNLSFDKLVNRLNLIINTLLYLFFILICLLFQYLQITPPSDCGARVLVVAAVAVQANLALVYAVVIAFISFVVGIGFIAFGSKLFAELNTNTSKRLSKKTRLQKQTFIITLVCSISFILHCIFILILATLKQANIIFSFVGLLVTEVAPSFILLAVSENLKESSSSSTSGISGVETADTEEDNTIAMQRSSFQYSQSELPEPELPGDDSLPGAE